MKSTLITLAFAFTSILTAAQTSSYTDAMIVSIDGSVVDSQTSTIHVAATANGTYDFTLKNFILKNSTGPMPIGNISLSGITVTEFDGIKEFATEQNITITDGDNGNGWVGTYFGEVPVKLTGKMTAHKLYCIIDMTLIGQAINIVFGNKNLTGIDEITGGSEDIKVIHDLTGRRIDTVTSAGVYIVNGKKVVFM
jgi:hypothetical protein